MRMNPNFIITDIQRVILVGKDEYPETKSQFSTRLNSNELIFKLSGHSTVHFGSKTLNIVPNTVWFLPKGCTSQYLVERLEHGECIDVFFNSNVAVSDEAFSFNPIAAEKLSALFRKLFSVWVAKNDGYYFESISLLYKIFAQLQKQTYLPDNQYAVIKPALAYIEKHFPHKKITSEILSAQCGVSYTYFKSIFLKKFGMTPTKYMIWLKMNYACDLLRTELYSITRTAELCGYSDVYYFSRQFKEYMGISPTQFVKKYISSK